MSALSESKLNWEKYLGEAFFKALSPLYLFIRGLEAPLLLTNLF